MAKGEIKMKMTIDSFITNTRVHLCQQTECEYNVAVRRGSREYDCQLKIIEIGRSGQCQQFKLAKRFAKEGGA
jgi:hypothetical protein